MCLVKGGAAPRRIEFSLLRQRSQMEAGAALDSLLAYGPLSAHRQGTDDGSMITHCFGCFPKSAEIELESKIVVLGIAS